MKPKLIRVRNRNQITLPAEMFEGVTPGDFLQVRQVGPGAIELRVARIVPFGTRAADQEEERAEAEIREGRSRVFSSPEALLESFSPAEGQEPASSVAETAPDKAESARPPEEVLLPEPASAPASPNEDELVRAAQEGDTFAFEALMQRYDRTVLRLALHLTGSPDEAQDLCQEAFLTAFRKIRTFRFETSFYEWIYRIVTNACVDRLRERSHKPEDEEVALAVNALESAQKKPESSAPGLLTYAKSFVSSPRHRQFAKQCVIDYVAYGKELGAPLQPEYVNGVRQKLIRSLEQSKEGVGKERKADSA